MNDRRPIQLGVRDFKLVDSVAQHGTLTAACAVLNVTQSALSHQLADLERRLGCPVFDRVGRRMEVTPLGSRIRMAGSSVLDALGSAEEQVRLALDEKSSVLRFATECYTCYHWLPPLLSQFNERFPNVETRIVAEATADPLTALDAGELDLALVSSTRSTRGRERTEVLQDELVAVVAPHHPWATRRFVRAKDFGGEHLISYTPLSGSTLHRWFLAPAGAHPGRVSVVPLTEAIIEMVRAGLGIAVLARWAVVPHIEAGSIAVARLGARGLRRTWSSVTKRLRTPQPHLTAFIELLRGCELGGDTGRPLHGRT